MAKTTKSRNEVLERTKIFGVPRKNFKELADFFKKSDLSELFLEDKGVSLKLKKRERSAAVPAAPAPMAPAAVPAAAVAEPQADTGQEKTSGGPTIDSPIIGTFYEASSPEAAPFVKPGDTVEKEQTLCIVEAMKVMNEIKAEKRCTIQTVLIENGQSVEQGQPLFEISGG